MYHKTYVFVAIKLYPLNAVFVAMFGKIKINI